MLYECGRIHVLAVSDFISSSSQGIPHMMRFSLSSHRVIASSMRVAALDEIFASFYSMIVPPQAPRTDWMLSQPSLTLATTFSPTFVVADPTKLSVSSIDPLGASIAIPDYQCTEHLPFLQPRRSKDYRKTLGEAQQTQNWFYGYRTTNRQYEGRRA